MRLISAAEAREIDRRAAEEFHLSTAILMENAGLRSADWIERELLDDSRKRVVIVAGRGNNAGDGFVLARHLFNRGYGVRIFCLYESDGMTADAFANFRILTSLGVPVDYLPENSELTPFRIALLAGDVVVDALFGSGFQGEMKEWPAAVIRMMNESNRPVVSLDIPSGVQADNGKAAATAVRATHTITYGLPKLGNVLADGAELNGALHTVDISFPPQLTAESENDGLLLDGDWVQSHLLPRRPDTHKGNYGHVLVAGGSPTMSGSVQMAAEGALKSGAGLVTMLVPQSIHMAVISRCREAMTLPLPATDEGSLAASSAELILQQTGNKILVLGMGLTRHGDSKILIKKLLQHINCPLVLDADALLALGEYEDQRRSNQPLILTPHPGEMARILNCSIREVQEDRPGSVLEAAKRWNATVVLKGNRTLIATAGGRLMVNLTGNAGMATGGMGDVLSGVIGALLGQGYSPEHAAALGVYFHGLAGDKAAESRGLMGLTALDVANALPAVFCAAERLL